MQDMPALENSPAAIAGRGVVLKILDTPGKRRKYARRVWQMITKTYEGYGNSEDGNLYGAALTDLIETPGLWEILLHEGRIVVGVVYRTHKGSKVRLVFHNDTREGKHEFKEFFIGRFKAGQCWAELSGNLERILLAADVETISNVHAAEVLGKEILELDPDGVHYRREVYPGTVKREMLFGHVEE